MKKWYLGYVWKNVNMGMLFGGDILLVIYFRRLSKKKNKFYIFPYSQKKKHYSIYTTFQYFSQQKVHYFRFSRTFPTIAITSSAHRLNSFFAGAYLYLLSCVSKTGQNAVTHCETMIFSHSRSASIIISNIYIWHKYNNDK